ncbi:MAG TPA: hypothetical protein VK949_05300 [Methylotenera sp.]|nr:hypothetical protein [Methylotenera sp.]
MFKHFAHIFAYLLLVMMPLQSIAAASMLVCNSVMQSHDAKAADIGVSNQQLETMPCHEHMAHMASSHTSNSKHKDACKSTCGALCSTLCAMTALPNGINTTPTISSSSLIALMEQSYASITLPNTQRPPIFLS